MSPVGRACALAAVVFAVLTFATWDRGDGQAAARPRAGGADLFRAKGCAACHVGPDSSPMVVSGFPRLTGAGEWAGTRRPGMTAEEYLAESMRTPNAFISPAFSGQVGPTMGMPQLHLDAAEIDALVDYLLGVGDEPDEVSD